MGAFLAVAVVVFVLVIAGIYFGSRRGGKNDGNEAAGGYYGPYDDGHHDHGATAEAGSTGGTAMAVVGEETVAEVVVATDHALREHPVDAVPTTHALRSTYAPN